MTGLIFDLGPTSRYPLTFYLTLIKLLAILIIICKLAHQNNDNHIFLLVTIYIYLASIKVETIIFFNRFAFFVLYNILLKKLKGITTFCIIFIKKQTFNYNFNSI